MNKKDIENKQLVELNDFMKKFGVESINFGKSHSVKQTKGKKAKSIIHNKKSSK